MKFEDLISIVIPVYNHEEALKQALQSINAQVDVLAEIIIVDDGSDKAIDPMWCSSSKFPCKLIRQENKGAPAARNKGMQESTGEYIIFWDADVVAKPNMLVQMRDTLKAHPEASYAYCDYIFGRKKMPAQAFDVEELRKRNYIHSTSLIRRTDALAWDESLRRFQDWDLWLMMGDKNKRGVHIPEYLFHVIPNTSGMSTWLPSFAYKRPWSAFPWVRSRVAAYNQARAVIAKKHGLTFSP